MTGNRKRVYLATPEKPLRETEVMAIYERMALCDFLT
jgi:hypothetical protein